MIYLNHICSIKRNDFKILGTNTYFGVSLENMVSKVIKFKLQQSELKIHSMYRMYTILQNNSLSQFRQV